MKKIIILNFSNGEVLVYQYDNNIWNDAEEFLTSDEIDLNPNQCQWMIVDELTIKIKD